MSLVVPEQHQQFQHILRLLNTNVDGKRKVQYALTEIKGVGRRYSNIVFKKADVDLKKRAGDLNSDELERIVNIMQNPTQFKIPLWFLNRQKDIVDGKYGQILSNNVDSKLRDDLERLRRSAATGVSDTSGVFVCVVSIPRPLVAEERLLVCQRSVARWFRPLIKMVLVHVQWPFCYIAAVCCMLLC